MNEVIIRPAIPEDVEQAVPLIYSSGPAAFDYVFKTNNNSAQDYLFFAFKRTGGEFSFQNHFSIVHNTKVVGAGAVFTGAEMMAFTISEGRNILKFYGIKGLNIMARGLRIESLIKPPHKNEVAIAHLGVHSSMRGKGLGTRLIQELMNNSKVKNLGNYVLDVSVENPKAQELYKKLGFRVSRKCISSLKNNHASVVDHNRMEKKILTIDSTQ